MVGLRGGEERMGKEGEGAGIGMASGWMLGLR